MSSIKRLNDGEDKNQSIHADSNQGATGSKTGAAQLTEFGILAPFSAALELHAAPDKGEFLKKGNRQRKFHWT